MRLSGTKTGSINQYNGLGDQLYDLGGARPTLDLNFASNGSLVDSVTGKTLVTHTRASNATYVDGDGIIKDAVTNYLKYSENIGFSGWNVRSGTTATANQEAPNGSNTATLITNSSGDGYVWRNDAGFTSGGDFVLSVYAKRISGTPTLSPSMWLGTSAGSSTDQGESVTDEWERYDFDLTRQYAAGGQDYGFLVQDGSVLLWGAQLEKASTVGEYVKTTSTVNSAPRFDHNPETGESLGLLVEESRTNLITNSDLLSDFDASTPNTIIATATKTAPDNGTQVAQLTAVNAINARCRAKFSASSANNITVSAFVKKNTHRYVQIGFGGSTNGFCATFDIELGVANRLLSQGGSGTYTNIDAGYQDYANDWVKIWAVGTTTGTDGPGVAIVEDGTKTNFNDLNVFDGTESIYVWGAQYEDNATFPTSYIRTNGSTVTRAADITQISGNDFGTFNLLQYSEHLAQPYVAPNGWGTSAGLTKAPNTAIAPDGTKTATRLTQPGGASSQFFQRADTLPAGTYTLSVYAKAVSGSVNFALNAWNSTDGAQISPVVTATTEWQRFTHTFTTTVTDSFIYPFVGDGTTVAGDIDFWGAQLEESSTATPYVKSDVTWTSRASNATYYDKDGVLRKSSYNLVVRSEEFDNSGWSKYETSVVANNIAAPNGTTTADKIVESSANDFHALYQSVSATANTTYTQSCYAKQGERRYIRMYVGGSSAWSSLPQATFDLQEGTVVNGIGTIADAGNGWYRVSCTGTYGASSSNTTFNFGPANPSNLGTVYYQGDGSSSLYVWGYQVETGPYAGDYAKTTSAAASTARTNAYLPDGSGNFVSAGELLLEDAGTNLAASSEDFSSAWTDNNAIVTVNQVTAPDGTDTADKLIPDTSANRHWLQVSLGTTLTTYTVSVFAKAGELSTITVRVGRALSTQEGAKFNLSTGTISNQGTGIDSASIEPVGNGWYRCVVTNTCTIAGVQYYALSHDDGDLTAGDGTSGIYIWGAQAEESAYATSYIPTYGSTATRAADVSTSSSNTFGNSFYNQTEGTVFSDNRLNSGNTGSYSPGIVSINDGTNQNEILQFYSSATQVNGYVKAAGVTVANVAGGSFVSGSNVRAASAFGFNDVNSATNGLLGTADTNVALPTVTTLKIGQQVSAALLNGTISRLVYWGQRLPNSTLQAITQ